VVPKLFAKQVITFHEKCIIDSKKIEMEKMMFILDNVIIPTLMFDISTRFEEFLQVMEESDNTELTDMAKILGTYVK